MATPTRAFANSKNHQTSKEAIASAEAELAVAMAQLEAIRKMRHRA